MDNRITTKGKISDLSNGFTLPGGVSFSVYVRSKQITMENDTLLNCKLIGDIQSGDLPVPIGDWSPAMIASISPEGIDLDKYEIWWGAGEYVSNL